MRSLVLDNRVSLLATQELSNSQLQIDSTLSRLGDEISNPLTVAAMLGGGFVFRGSNFLLSRLTTPLLAESGLLTRTLAQTAIRGMSLANEVATFRAISQGPSQIFQGRGFATDYLCFGLLKGVGNVAQGQNPFVAHFLQASGMVAGQNFAYGFGFADKPQGSIIEQFAHAEATNIVMSASMAIVSPLTGGRFNQLEKVMELTTQASLTPRLRMASSPFSSEPVMMSSESIAHNTRVNGPVLEIISRGTATTQVPRDGFMGRMINPADGFDSFVMPDGTQVVWLGKSNDYPGILGERLATTWNNALGAVLVANPRMDSMGLIVMHGAMKNKWAPDASGTSPVWRGLGGMMAFPKSVPHARDLMPLLSALGVSASGEAFRMESLSPEHQSWVNLLGAAEKTNGKAMGMTPKWRFIDEALAGIGLVGENGSTGLGGMKSVVLHDPNDSAKEQAVRMMARVARTLGIYISGGDEGTARGPWTDIYAQEAPLNMAGSKNAHHLIRGQYPSVYTARGVFSGIENYFAVSNLDSSRSPVFFQGVGGVGRNVIEMAIEKSYSIAGITDIMASDLVATRTMAQGKGYLNIPFVWDRESAFESLDTATFEREETVARESGLLVGHGLMDSIRISREEAQGLGQTGNIPVVSLNATSHQITIERLDQLAGYGVQAVIGGANNMLELDNNGSYLPVAQHALARNIFIPNDSAINRMGATIVLANALGLDAGRSTLLADWVGAYSAREYTLGHVRGIPPQVYSDQKAQAAWNALIDSGEAMGGRFRAP